MSEQCPATREAIIEQEEFGEIGCPLCGRAASKHESEDQWAIDADTLLSRLDAEEMDR